jgi:3-oxoacyl-[acyl-carrier protein] reductase
MFSCRLLDGKVALVTGCNRGIGAAILDSFAANGAIVLAAARRDAPEFRGKIEAVGRKHGTRITPVFFDLSNEAATKESLKKALGGEPRVDVLVNNAGVAHGGFLQMTSLAKIREVYEINYFGQLVVTQAVARVMMRQKGGSIVNIVSVAGLDPNPGNSAYGASKAALAYATRALAKELAPFNIRVNGVAPGLTETAMAEQMEEKARQQMVSASAMNRLAQTSEIANAVVYLASDLASFTTGQILRVDGGM